MTLEFEKRINKYSEEYKSSNRQFNIIATVRIMVFLFFLIGFIAFANYKMGAAMGITAMAFPFIFGLIVKRHQKIKYKRQHARFLKEINENEIEILKGSIKDQDPGLEFIEKGHPYAGDLDVFGQNSLFQLVNRTSTKGGKDMLASWLLHSAEKNEINNRQRAVRELSMKIDWRQDFQARGMHFEMQKTTSEALINWIHNKYPLSSVYRIAAFLIPPMLIASLLLNIFTSWPFFVSLIVILFSWVVLNRFQNHLTHLTESVLKHIKVLGAYGSLIAKIEETDFEIEKLNALKSNIIHEGYKASDSIKRLFAILDYLNARSNFFYMIIDVILLFDIHIILMAERWKARNEADVINWFRAISEFEALSSLAALSYSKPDFIFPEISNEEYLIDVNEMGHPLIKEDERVANDYLLTGKGSISIITGSNMAGKSTFLRTLGVNLILAQAGGAVCAKKFIFSLVQVFTSMRTQDNLEEHVSSFYAELQRIKELLELVENDTPILYMLDEILKGTNSQDRHIGAVSLAKQLSKTNSFGLISTHDLALGELASTMKNISNYSFNSIVEGDKIIFPYKLDNSICKSFNASKLMEKIGIKIEPA